MKIKHMVTVLFTGQLYSNKQINERMKQGKQETINVHHYGNDRNSFKAQPQSKDQCIGTYPECNINFPKCKQATSSSGIENW